jgi:transcriptional regulator with XRE-family HTH domain
MLREESVVHQLSLPAPGKLALAMSFGQWLREERTRRRLSQEELARDVGCTGSYISLLECAKPDRRSGVPLRPSVEVVDAVAAALGVSRREARLAAGYVPPEDAAMTEREIRLLEAYRSLPPDVQSVIDTQLDALRESHARHSR